MCAVAKDTPREGSRLVEAAIDSEAEESAPPPNVFPSEIHASAMFQVVAEFKAADKLEFQILANDNGANVCGWASKLLMSSTH